MDKGLVNSQPNVAPESDEWNPLHDLLQLYKVTEKILMKLDKKEAQ